MVWSKVRGWFGFRSAVPGIALLLMVTFVGLGNAAAATTHYISASGSDSNNGTSKTTPWLHLPGMPGCTSACASYNAVAGDQFIFKGGDTWGAASLGIDWEWSGTSGSRIYIGVDQTWFSGASWTRPIFNCQNTSCASATYGNVIWLAGSYTTIDNVEFTGYQQSGGGNLVGVYGNNNEVENFYIHGWSRTSGSSGINSFALTNNWSGGGALGTKFHDNVIDGQDSPNKDFMGGILHGVEVYNNVIRYVYNGMNGNFDDVHGNRVEHNYISTSGDHCNLIFIQGPASTNGVVAYNNVIDNQGGCSGGSTLWIIGNSSCAGCTSYVYNNLIYDTSVGFDSQGVAIGGHASTGNIGTVYVYNNTIQPGGSCWGSGDTGGLNLATVHYANNHCISSEGYCLSTAVTCVNDGNNLLQTTAQADANASSHFDQYIDTQTFPYSPVASANSTVGLGANKTSTGTLSCSVAPALCSDSAYATYNTTNHTVVMRAAIPRPASGAWDIGAYEYGAQMPPPNPPTGLAAVVQ